MQEGKGLREKEAPHLQSACKTSNLQIDSGLAHGLQATNFTL